MTEASDEFVVENDSYDAATILWAQENNSWERLRGAIVNDEQLRRRAVQWARTQVKEKP